MYIGKSLFIVGDSADSVLTIYGDVGVSQLSEEVPRSKVQEILAIIIRIMHLMMHLMMHILADKCDMYLCQPPQQSTLCMM